MSTTTPTQIETIPYLCGGEWRESATGKVGFVRAEGGRSADLMPGVAADDRASAIAKTMIDEHRSLDEALTRAGHTDVRLDLDAIARGEASGPA